MEGNCLTHCLELMQLPAECHSLLHLVQLSKIDDSNSISIDLSS